MLVSDVKEMFREQYEFRELLSQMVRRDFLLRYKQTIMGFAWAIFMPLVNTVVFSIVFMKVAPLDVGAPYPIFAYSGLLVWNFTASALRFATVSLTSNITLVTKVYFPREIFPITAVIVAAADSVVGALVLVGMMIYYQIPPGPAVLFVPVILLVQFLFTSGVALVLSMANLFYRDVKYLFEVVITVWMFATSVLYPLDRVGGKMGVVMQLNPMSHIVNAYRSAILEGALPPAAFAVVAAFSAILFLLAWLMFHRAEYQFAERA